MPVRRLGVHYCMHSFMVFPPFDFAFVHGLVAGFAPRRRWARWRCGACAAPFPWGGLGLLSPGLAQRSPVERAEGTAAVNAVGRDVTTTFSMAITNPAMMIAAAGLFAAFAPVDMCATPGTAALLITGVFTGSTIWWLISSAAVGTFREAFVERGLPYLNRISGTIIALSGTGVLIAAAIKIMR